MVKVRWLNGQAGIIAVTDPFEARVRGPLPTAAVGAGPVVQTLKT